MTDLAESIGDFTFSNLERLKSKKIIKELFEKGSSFYFHPFRLFYLPDSDPSLVKPQILFSVPKKNFRSAVDRNKIKRQLREAYRLNRHKLVGLSLEKEKTLPKAIGIMYVSKEKLPFSLIQDKLILSFERFFQ
jgi:ribonuclease P protein component